VHISTGLCFIGEKNPAVWSASPIELCGSHDVHVNYLDSLPTAFGKVHSIEDTKGSEAFFTSHAMGVIGTPRVIIDVGPTSWWQEDSVRTAKKTTRHHYRDIQQNKLGPDVVIATSPYRKENEGQFDNAFGTCTSLLYEQVDKMQIYVKVGGTYSYYAVLKN
jgi:hypothetical protein